MIALYILAAITGAFAAGLYTALAKFGDVQGVVAVELKSTPTTGPVPSRARPSAPVRNNTLGRNPPVAPPKRPEPAQPVSQPIVHTPPSMPQPPPSSSEPASIQPELPAQPPLSDDFIRARKATMKEGVEPDWSKFEGRELELLQKTWKRRQKREERRRNRKKRGENK